RHRRAPAPPGARVLGRPGPRAPGSSCARVLVRPGPRAPGSSCARVLVRPGPRAPGSSGAGVRWPAGFRVGEEDWVLGSAEMIAFVPSSDLERSRRFFGDLLGLAVEEVT